MENQADYTTRLISEVIKINAKSIEARKTPTDNYQSYLGSMLQGTVWTSGCASWYKSARGVDWILWPSNMVVLWWNLARNELKDFIIQ